MIQNLSHRAPSPTRALVRIEAALSFMLLQKRVWKSVVDHNNDNEKDNGREAHIGSSSFSRVA